MDGEESINSLGYTIVSKSGRSHCKRAIIICWNANQTAGVWRVSLANPFISVLLQCRIHPFYFFYERIHDMVLDVLVFYEPHSNAGQIRHPQSSGWIVRELIKISVSHPWSNSA
jgi:hypothetical protein